TSVRPLPRGVRSEPPAASVRVVGYKTNTHPLPQAVLTCSFFERDDRPAEADGPAARALREEKSFERVRRARCFRAPSRAAVRGVNRDAFAAHGPALALVEELHVEEF